MLLTGRFAPPPGWSHGRKDRGGADGRE